MSAFKIKDGADGMTSYVATLFWTVSLTVTLNPFQAIVALARSSAVFFGFKPNGPTFGPSEAPAEASPARTLTISSFFSFGFGFGGSVVVLLSYCAR